MALNLRSALFLPLALAVLASCQSVRQMTMVDRCSPSSFGYFTAGHGETELFSLATDRDVQIQIIFVLNGAAKPRPATLVLTSLDGIAHKVLKGPTSVAATARAASIVTAQFPPLGGSVVTGCWRFL